MLGRKAWDETRMLAHLAEDAIRLPLTKIRLLAMEEHLPKNIAVDAIVEVTCRGDVQRYVVECKGRSTPQTIQAAILQVQQYTRAMGLPPMVFVPYLSEEALSSLEEAGVSGIDLSGNGVILASTFTVWRSGQRNLYPEGQTVKNLYRGVSTIFVRCFLLRPEFESLKDLREYALSRLSQDVWSNGEAILTMGTASKVVRQLEEDLAIRREGRILRISDAERLMEGLKANYRPHDGARIAGKTPFSVDEAWRRLGGQRGTMDGNVFTWRYSVTGLGSAAKYQVLSGPEKLSLYVTDLDRAADLIDLRATRVFPNVELIENRGDAEYFDARGEGVEMWASPIQTWLELATGGPREREAAQSLASVLAKSRGEQLT